MTAQGKHSYRFADVWVDPQRRLVLRNQEKLQISKKGFDILIALIEREGDVITKDQLIQQVWPNQIVTDAALAKQVTRLRLVFDAPESEGSVIETVRGVGFRWVPEIEIVAADTSIKDGVKGKSHSLVNATPAGYSAQFWLILALLMSIAIIITLSIKQKAVETTEDTKNINSPVNIAVLPFELEDDWLSSGLVNHVSERLDINNSLLQNWQLMVPEYSRLQQTNPVNLSIELSNQDAINYALSVRSQKQDGQFRSQLILRNSEGILARHEVIASSLNLLMRKMQQWLFLEITQAEIKGPSEASNNSSQNPDPLNNTDLMEQIELISDNVSDFVLESYLRGLNAAYRREYSNAAQLMQTALNQDQDFYPAWLHLAEYEAELGQFQKSLALSQSIEEKGELTQQQSLQLQLIKAGALTYLNRLQEAQELLDQIIPTLQENNNHALLIKALTRQTQIHSRYGEISEQTLALIQRQMALVEQYRPLPLELGRLNNNLAVTYQALGDLQLTRTHLNKAIEKFNSANNATGLVDAHRILSDLEYQLGNIGDALLVLQKVSGLLGQVDEPIVVARYLRAQARSEYLQGHKSKALQTIDRIEQMSITYATQQANVLADIVLAELHIGYSEMDKARQTVDRLLAIIGAAPELYPADASYVVAMDMYLVAHMLKPNRARETVQAYLQAYPSLKQALETELKWIEGLILSKEGFHLQAAELLQEVQDSYMRKQFFIDAVFITYELLDMQWQRDMSGYEKNLNRILEFDQIIYPTLKYRARLLASNEQWLEAAAMMLQLKSQAKELWSSDDQIELESYQLQVQ